MSILPSASTAVSQRSWRHALALRLDVAGKPLSLCEAAEFFIEQHADLSPRSISCNDGPIWRMEIRQATRPWGVESLRPIRDGLIRVVNSLFERISGCLPLRFSLLDIRWRDFVSEANRVVITVFRSTRVVNDCVPERMPRSTKTIPVAIFRRGICLYLTVTRLRIG